MAGDGGTFIVCVTGMPGAGKTTATKALSGLGFQTVSMGDVVRREAEKRGLGLDKDGQKRMMLLLREEGGPAAVAKLSAAEIRQRGLRRAVVDGARSMEEINVFKEIGVVKILCLHASPGRRFELLRSRARSDDPLSYADFEARDQRELDLGLGRVIALSDRMIENEVTDISDLDDRVRGIVSYWLEKE
jgi:dephospho-CoA kinase